MLSGGKVVVFDRFVAIFGQKFWGGIFLLSKSLSGYFKTKKKKRKKVPMATELGWGWGCKALVTRPLKKLLFLAASLIH